MFKNILLVGLGGGLGTILRYLVSHFFKTPGFPFATFLINIIGSFVIGIVIGLSIKDTGFSQNWKLFLTTGICGGFTTFSAFSIENLQLMQHGKYTLAFVYIFSSIVLGIGAAWLGFKLANN